MAKFKGDYYTIEKDDREIGGDLVVLATIDDWKEAKQAWEQTPEPESGCVWLGKNNRNVPDYGETLACKGPDRDPLWDAWNNTIQELADAGTVKIRGPALFKKQTRH